ncbi:PEPxxWA-CTERM sorting domain-containing protein [Phenylobacterium sp.]|uniref:PEPxxWA-CTERM sorting domain-containing protein n=1 Tax=Phenylobacterium sp. TaxID=1871053 RepID=UPI0025DB23AA|nr:PEPxxWA-CTERM sorting domain-containing protein [Phenylobacterium sp.]
MMLRLFPACAAALFLTLAGASAAATTYVSVRPVGAAEAQVSITTDGTLGVLTAANITAWRVVVTDGDHTRQMENGKFLSLPVVVEGTGLTATATDLLFDFDSAGFVNFTQQSGVFFGFPLNPARYCLQGLAREQAEGDCAFDPFDNEGSERIKVAIAFPNEFTANFRSGHAGVEVLASVAADPTTGVPEPASWALMILGFAGAGAALRRRKALRFGPEPLRRGEALGGQFAGAGSPA